MVVIPEEMDCAGAVVEQSAGKSFSFVGFRRQICEGDHVIVYFVSHLLFVFSFVLFL